MPLRQNRKLNRWPGHDYSLPGYYFITICTKNRQVVFGEVFNYKMELNEFGQISADFLQDIPKHFNNCELDEFIVMPNHVHCLLYINYKNEKEHLKIVVDADLRPLRNTECLLSKIIHQFKSSVTREIHKQDCLHFQWQRSFYDRVIRNETELSRIRKYIFDNPVKWVKDINNPINFIHP